MDHITSTRGSRFVDHMTCPMCGRERLGLEYQGLRASGEEMHTIAAHSPGAGRMMKGQSRCLGAGLFVVFEGGVWKGAQR